jgi:phospholipase D
MKINYLIFLSLLFSFSAFSENYDVCFTPSERCDLKIIKNIDESKTEIDLMAYELTSENIITSLENAQKRKVNVIVILDKSQKRYYQKYHDLINDGAKIFIDYKPKIAHNKVIIFDNKKILTGSYNFTMSAQWKNAENYVIIDSASLAKSYKNYFNSRISKSRYF